MFFFCLPCPLTTPANSIYCYLHWQWDAAHRACVLSYEDYFSYFCSVRIVLRRHHWLAITCHLESTLRLQLEWCLVARHSRVRLECHFGLYMAFYMNIIITSLFNWVTCGQGSVFLTWISRNAPLFKKTMWSMLVTVGHVVPSLYIYFLQCTDDLLRTLLLLWHYRIHTCMCPSPCGASSHNCKFVHVLNKYSILVNFKLFSWMLSVFCNIFQLMTEIALPKWHELCSCRNIYITQ